MKQFPATPTAADAPDELFASGHLWLLEYVRGAPLRFQVRDSGLVQFGDDERVYDDPDDVPERYRRAVDHVRERLDRDALREAVTDPTDVVFFGVATVHRGIDYDWERTPAVLGTDVWSAEADGYLGPDAVEAIFERLGLQSVNAIERELPARDFDPDAYEFPESAWYDGPAAGVVVRKKGGGRARLDNPAVGADGPAPSDGAADAGDDADALAEQYATPARFERLAAALDERGQSVTAETLAERALEAIARETHPQRYGEDGAVDRAAVRSEVAALARAFLDERPDDAW